MNKTYRVSLGVQEAANVIDSAVVGGSFTGECLDRYEIAAPSGTCVVLVFEKYYGRVGNRLTLTVVIDNFGDATRIHCVSGGGGQSVLFKFDWGASGSFSAVVERALAPYLV